MDPLEEPVGERTSRGVWRQVPRSRASNAATDAKQTTVVSRTANTRHASTSRAVPIRLTARISRQSAMVGDSPAACATARNAAELRHPGRVPSHPPGSFYVQDEGPPPGAMTGGRQHVRLGGQHRLVVIDEQEGIDHVGHALGARCAHAVARPVAMPTVMCCPLSLV